MWKLLAFVIIPLGFLFFPNFFQVDAVWIKHSKQPVLQTGSIGTWDDARVGSPSVIRDGSDFKMWYEGNDGSNWRIGYASSTDGISWAKYPTFIIDRSDDLNNKNVHDPRVIFKNNNYQMWYAASSQTIDNIHINYTSSADGIQWKSKSSNVLLPFYNWELPKGISFPFVNYISNQYKMWYGANGNYNGETRWRIGYATSIDGIIWAKHPIPIIETTLLWEGIDIASPNILFDNGVYHMWYHGDFGIGHATSLDGIAWVKDNNPVLTPDNNLSSFDNHRVMNPFVLKKDGIYYMYYTGVNSDGKWQIGLATSEQLPTPPFFPTPTLSPTISPTLTATPTPIILPSITPSVTPAPPTTPFAPIIIVPGLGTSWNPRAIFSCNLSPSGFWKLAPYVSSYNRLIKTLTKNAKLKLGSDVYVYAYDWRLPLDQQGEELKNYINGLLTNKPPGTKVRLIGHSLGGLVIRSYLENNPNSHQVKAVMTIGSPHQGTVLAYSIWEKGEIWTDDWLIKIALTQLVNHCRYTIRPATPEEPRISRFKIKSGKEIVQLLAPAIKQLLPIFDFLRQNGSIKKTSSLIHQNDWLFSHPLPINFYNVDFNTLSGGNIPTLRYLEVVAPSTEEQTAGDWLDGRPVNQETISQGDGTVLQMSSQVEGAKNEIITGNHGEIIAGNQGIQKILQFLDLEKVKPAEAIPIPEETTQRVLMISLDKEAKLELTDPKGKTLISEDNIVVFYNPERGTFRLRITPVVSDQAYLHLIQIERGQEAKSKTYTLHLRKDKPINFLLPYTPFNSSTLQLTPVR